MYSAISRYLRIWLFVPCLLLCPVLVAQSGDSLQADSSRLVPAPVRPGIDSLKLDLEVRIVRDSAYVMTLLRLAHKLSYNQPEEGRKYAKEGLAISKELQNSVLLAKAYNAIGITYIPQDRHAESLHALKLALSYAREADHQLLIADIHNNLGIIYRDLSDLPKSLSVYLLAQRKFDSLDFKSGIARVSNNLGNLYKVMGKTEEARVQYEQAKRYYGTLEKPDGYASSQLNLGMLLTQEERFGEAKAYLDSALTYYLTTSLTYREILVRNALGHLLVHQGIYDEAERYLTPALEKATELDMQELAFAVLANLANIRTGQGRFAEARAYAQRAQEYADSVEGYRLKAQSAELWASIYQKSEDWESAFTYFQRFKSWTDSAYLELQEDLYATRETQEEVYAQEQQLAEQAIAMQFLEERVALENRWNWTLGGAALLLLLLGGLYYKRYQKEHRLSRELERQNQLISDQKAEIASSNEQLEEQMRLRREIDETIHYFAGSLIGKNTVDEILWDVARNCISRIGLVDCVIYLVDEPGQKLIQKAAFGWKHKGENEISEPIQISIGEGIVGAAVASGSAQLVPDVRSDTRYILDGTPAGSELAVPLLHRDKVIGIIDSEHPEPGFFTRFHLEVLRTIAVICSSKIAQAQADEEAMAATRVRIEAEQIKAMDQLKTQFFTNISHEFRTPLNLILGPLRTHHEEIPLPELGMMQRNAERLLRLVNQLLDLSRLEVGQLALTLRHVEVYAFLREICASFQALMDSRRIQFQIDIPPGQQLVQLDPDKLEKILYNLLSNAHKFTPEGGTVSFHAAIETPLTLRFTVSDTGMGVPESLQDKIFDRFFQVDGSATRSFEGTGIGLALTKELTTLWGGSIELESEWEQGCRFLVTLPLQPAEQAYADDLSATLLPLESESAGSEEDQLSAGTRLSADAPILLVVEDNQDLRRYLLEQLGREFRVLEAENGEKGLVLAMEQVPDVIITDIMMPVMDGVSMTQQLKAQVQTSHIPVILLTAKDDPISRTEGFETGATQYISKPFDPPELRARITSVLDQQQRLRDKFSRAVYLKPTEVPIQDHEANFLEGLIAIVEAHLDDSAFKVEQLQRELGMSRMQLHRKLKAVTGKSTSEFIRYIRLQRAAELLSQPNSQVADVAYRVGFNHLSYFSRCFKEQFGVVPSEYPADSLST